MKHYTVKYILNDRKMKTTVFAANKYDAMNQIIWTQEKKEKAIEMLTEYFKKYGIGECIMQSDNALIDAPDLLSDIADNVLIEGEGVIFIED